MTAPTVPNQAAVRRMIALVALVCAAPFISAWIAYYLIKPSGGDSYGELLPTRPVPALQGADEVKERIRGRWLLLHQYEGTCDKACEDMLYVTRQAHTMLGRERDRVVRILLGSVVLNQAQKQAHPDLLQIAAPPPTSDIARRLTGATVLIDPLGNQVITWPYQADIKKLNRDLMRLLRASRIG